MLPLLDVQLEWCFAELNGYPSVGYGSFVRPCRSLCGITYLFSFLPIYFSTWNRWYISHRDTQRECLTFWRCWLDSCRMFILLVEYGLVHRWLYKLWDMLLLFLFWSGICMAESWTRRLSLCLACKPFQGLCACTRTGRRWTSVVAIRSLSLFTNRADRRSQINSLDSWCATRVSKTLDVVHWYGLLVSTASQ